MKEFPPARQRGLLIHIGLTIILSLLSILTLYQTFHISVGPLFAVYLLVFILSAILVPVLGYRAYALSRANYLLDRNVLRLLWGMRFEEIPVSDVEWIRPLNGLLAPISLPWFRLPGGILGVKQQVDIGKVEFLASDRNAIILVATSAKIFAISPENPSAFMAAFQKTIEMGSLNPIQGISQYPSFVVIRAWEFPLARFLWLLGAFLNVGLLLWVTLLIPTLPRVSLGYAVSGSLLESVPGVQLILLPLLSSFLFVIGLITGLFFYRRQELQILALSIWISGAISSLFFLVAVYFILTTPV